jgi:hypothetical protein
MITEKLIKKVLRKWLKKKLYINAPISTNSWNIDKNGFLCSSVSHIIHWKPIEKLEG